MLFSKLSTTVLPAVQSLNDCASFDKTVTPYLPQLYAFPQAFLERINSSSALQELYLSTNPLVSSFALALFLAPIVLVISEINKNYSQVDRLWSLLPAIYNIHYAVWAHLNGLPTLKVDNLAVVSVIWSARLTFNYWRKGGYSIGSEDYRWLIVKDKVGPIPFFLFNVTFIALWQNILLWLITTPAYILLLVSRHTDNTPTVADNLFPKAIFLLVVIEYFSDQQQWDFYAARTQYRDTAKPPVNKAGLPIYSRAQLDRGFNTSGLWALSRHPNFAAEQAVWVALYQWACFEAGTLVNWTAAGAFAYLALFQGSTWLTELISSGKYPEYKVYQKRVGRFLPKFGTMAMDEKVAIEAKKQK